MGQAAVDDGFEAPRLTGSLALDERLSGCPDGGRVKGMFFASIAAEASLRAGRRIGRDRYVPFRGYPVREWLELLPEAASAAYPGRHPKEGMRQFGLKAFQTFERSMAGRVLFSMAGRNISMAVGLTGRAFDVIGSHGSVTVLVNEPGRAVFGLRDMWDYIDAWHVGVYEGALRAFGHPGSVRVRLHGIADGDIEVRYAPAADRPLDPRPRSTQ